MTEQRRTSDDPMRAIVASLLGLMKFAPIGVAIGLGVKSWVEIELTTAEQNKRIAILEEMLSVKAVAEHVEWKTRIEMRVDALEER